MYYDRSPVFCVVVGCAMVSMASLRIQPALGQTHTTGRSTITPVISFKWNNVGADDSKIHCVRISNRGHLVAIRTSQALVLFKSENGKKVLSSDAVMAETQLFAPAMNCVAFEGSDRLVAFVCPGVRDRVRVIDLETRLESDYETKGGAINGIAFASDGKAIVISESRGKLRELDLNSGRQTTHLVRDRIIGSSFVIGNDGAFAAVTSHDATLTVASLSERNATSRRHSLDDNNRYAVVQIGNRENPISCLVVSDRSVNPWLNTVGFFGTHYTETAFRTPTSLLVRGTPDMAIALAIEPNGNSTVIEPLTGCIGPCSLALPDNIRHLAFSDDKRLFAVEEDGMVHLFETAKVLLPQSEGAPRTIAAMWDALRNVQDHRGLVAIAQLINDGDESVEWLERQFSSEIAKAKRFDEIIAALDKDSFAQREKASSELRESVAWNDKELEHQIKIVDSNEIKLRLAEVLTSGALAEQQLRIRRCLLVLDVIASERALKLTSKLANASQRSSLKDAIAASKRRLSQK